MANGMTNTSWIQPDGRRQGNIFWRESEKQTNFQQNGRMVYRNTCDNVLLR